MDAELDLERRLRALPAHIRLSAADEAAIARLAVASRSPAGARGRRALIPGVAGLLIALLAGNAAASYFAPTYAAALASAPAAGLVAGPTLRWSGLSADSLTPLSDSATSNGHTVRLVAGVADELRTVLFFDVDGAQAVPTKTRSSAWSALDVTVSDQFGHVYSATDSLGGATFQPLTGPAASVGARLTVRIATLTQSSSLPATEARGDWTLHATLLRQSGKALAVPPAVTFDGNTYRITSGRSDGLATVRFTVTGPVVERWRKATSDLAAGPPPATGKGSLAPTPAQIAAGQVEARDLWLTIMAPDGRPALAHGWDYQAQGTAINGEATFVANQPGVYHIRFGQGPEMSLTVPPSATH